jgi:hypothetical protein
MSTIFPEAMSYDTYKAYWSARMEQVRTLYYKKPGWGEKESDWAKAYERYLRNFF